MAVLTSEPAIARVRSTSSHPVRLLQLFAVTVMVLPADYVIRAVGAEGYAAALVAYIIFLAWVAATLFGLHDPRQFHYPVRITLGGIWVMTLASYVLMNRGLLSTIQLAAADRWLMQLAAASGIILVAAEWLHSLDDVRRVIRTLVWAGAFCGLVAALQFKAKTDLTKYLKLPGFSTNGIAAVNAVIGSRSGQSRVPGTATDPIELGVVAAMLLPLAAWLLMHDKERSKLHRWVPFIGIALAIPASVSRSAIIGVVVALGVLIISLPPVRRLKGLSAVPLAVGAVFVVAHGLLGTLKSFFLAGTGDSSVAHRVNNYPYVLQLIHQAPWFGQGGGTYIPLSAANILDNQYLTTAIELGILGMIALLFLLAWPAVAALVARAHTTDPEIRDLCAALAGAGFAGAICSATFDSFSFPMFASIQALIAGLTGTVWIIVHREAQMKLRTRSGGGS
jgi:O-antigen ligase